jgi:ABC-type branched-subunit amino acid transport system ATPase component
VSEPLLQVQGLSAGYGEVQVLWSIDLIVGAREIVALIGSNGAGKTTILKVLSGLLAVTIHGRAIWPTRVPQFVDWGSAADMAWPAPVRGRRCDR